MDVRYYLNELKWVGEVQILVLVALVVKRIVLRKSYLIPSYAKNTFVLQHTQLTSGQKIHFNESIIFLNNLSYSPVIDLSF